MEVIDFFEGVSHKILSDEPFHPEMPVYLEDLDRNVILGYIGESSGYMEINPAFFKKNKKLSLEIFPQLVDNIRNNRGSNIGIKSGDYLLRIPGYSRAGGASIDKREKPVYFASGNYGNLGNKRTSYDAGKKFVKLVGRKKYLIF